MASWGGGGGGLSSLSSGSPGCFGGGAFFLRSQLQRWGFFSLTVTVTATLCLTSTLHTSLFSILIITCVNSLPLLYRFHTVVQQLITMFLPSRTPQPGGGGYSFWVVLVGAAIGAGLGFLAANTHYQGGLKNLKHAITERNLFINDIVNPFAPEADAPYDPEFDPEKNFTTPAAELRIKFANLTQVRLIVMLIVFVARLLESPCCALSLLTLQFITYDVNVNDRKLK